MARLKTFIKIIFPIILGLLTDVVGSAYTSLSDSDKHFSDELIENVNWGIIVALITFIIQIYFELRKLFNRIEENTANSFYKGFFTLTSNNLREGLKNFEQSIGKAVSFDYIGRGVIFNFLIEAISKIGKSGFAMVDASVGDYVRYIRETLKAPEFNASATCLVRPYWFVVDEILKVTLAPYYTPEDIFGKAEHLPYFSAKNNRKKGGVRYQRIFVADEFIITEMLLTTYLDKIILDSHFTDCPICSYLKTECPIKNERLKISNLDDIPEIYWYKTEVNEAQNVNLIYTFVQNPTKYYAPELEDRVYLSNRFSSGIVLDIQFQFTNLERGILRINWGKERTIELPYIELKDSCQQIKINNNDHKFYDTFLNLLRISKVNNIEIKKRMIDHLTLLESLIVQHFKQDNIRNISVTIGNPKEIQKLLCGGHSTFLDCMKNAISKLKNDIDTKSLDQAYLDMVEYYNQNKIPKIAYIITNDRRHPEYPVRISQWYKNWKGIKNNVQTI